MNIGITLVKIVPSSNSCPNGYNYNVALTYTVTFTGSNLPGNLYTLQGNFTCNGQNLFYDLPNNGGTGSYTTSTNPYISSDGTNLYTTHPSCTAATTLNLNCMAVTVDINGPGINNQTINCTASAVPLPIGLSYFSGVNTQEGIALSWKTLTEKNNAFFTIEKSINGSEWENIKEIAGAGNSQVAQLYSYLDTKVSNGLNYYRLKQTDFDSKSSYSSLIYVLNSQGGIYCSNVWPNPAAENLNFEISAPADGVITYKFISDIGTSINKGELKFFTGRNEMQISTDDLASGYYLLELDFGNETKVYRKVVKL